MATTYLNVCLCVGSQKLSLQARFCEAAELTGRAHQIIFFKVIRHFHG